MQFQIINIIEPQSNLNNSNSDDSFTKSHSNLFFESLQNISIALENTFLRKFSDFAMKLYVVRTHQNRLIEAILMSTHNIPIL